MPDQPDELIIEFKSPIKNKAGDEITAITLREPTGKEWRLIDNLSGTDADIKLIAKVCGQPESVIEQMVISQIVEGGRYLAGFIPPAPKTGAEE
jgi:hypothetical protein